MTRLQIPPHAHAALIVVDVQRDFCPGGALPAPGGDAIVPAVNAYLSDAQALGLPIYASRDWHPAVTSHFKQYGGEWPPHCVKDSEGADFHSGLDLPARTIVISKGEDPGRPGYSAFDGHTHGGAPLLDDLRGKGIDTLFICGIATEYCVKATTLDALRNRLHAIVLTDAVAPIDAQPGDATRALAEMQQHGARTQ
ncbi:MAG: isochorismatase family protein [Vicinamibacterales bacterium]